MPGVKRPWLSDAEGFILPNHDTGRILTAESQRNTINPSVVVTDSSATDYDSVDESSVYSTPHPLLKKLDGAEPISGPKTIKSILRLCGSYDHDTNGHNRIISLEREINPRNPQHAFKRCKVCGSSTHTITDHYDIEWNPIWHLDNGCSRYMTGVKSYLHKYVEQPGPKVMFGDNSTCTTEGYGSIKCNGIVFIKVAFVDGLK
nr:retrovirus-related Pol polyprotein from transposon TNT 1-94 [Tanacetum cinerariifolium]GEX84302.1 retrovirus-related Pol polyprotein from transposon TNT 1-94 [Tanacetum cinerariifolium]